MIQISEHFKASASVKELGAIFRTARPFQHVVVDNVFDAVYLREVVREFQHASHNTQYKDATTQGKFTCDDWAAFHPHTRELISYLNCGPFVDFLAKVTGIDSLTSDPFLLGGGLHETQAGGFLKMHTDFNYHTRLQLDRRINAILFLNEGWEPSWGGELVLSDPSLKTFVRVPPLFNRLVVFSTHDHSFHGQPDPHSFPAGQTRKSIAMYYYSNGRPEGEIINRKLGTTYKARHFADLPVIERLKEAGRLLLGRKRVKR